MRYLVDTNILLSLSEPSRIDHADVEICLEVLLMRGDSLLYTSQIFGEFWNVSTRPVNSRGGLGLTAAETDRRLRVIEKRFILLEDNLRVHFQWRQLVVQHSVAGVAVHDARLVAAMAVHGVTHLVTNNVKDFSRYSALITAISVQDLNQAFQKTSSP